MKSISLFAVCLLSCGVTLAQDVRLQPNFGTVELAADFLPDPHAVAVIPGGDIDLATRAQQIGMKAEGFVANAPDVDLNFTAGGSALTIKVEGGTVDTVLLINAPDGRWWYVDDVNGLDPLITFPKPLSGNYNIWVGTIERNPGRAAVRLLITEL